jgi:hypothetical protein
VLPDWATDKLLYTLETRPEDWEIDELRRTAPTRLYVCPNCEAILWDRAGSGEYESYVPCERLIRIFADLQDRDPLGGIRLRRPRTLADIEAQHVLMRPGVYLVVHDDRQEIYGHMAWAVDHAGNPVPDAWVARPLESQEAAGLRARGA